MSRLNYPIDWSLIPPLPSARPTPKMSISPFPDEHYANSREMIARAAAMVPAGGRVQVLGAGWCRDIPVAVLAERFAQVVLCDIEEDRLRKGVRNQKDLTRPERVRLDFRDIATARDAFAPQA